MSDPAASALFAHLASVAQQPQAAPAQPQFTQPTPAPEQQYQLADGRIVSASQLAAMQQQAAAVQPQGVVGQVTAPASPPSFQPPTFVAPSPTGQTITPPSNAKPATTGRAPKTPKANSVSLILKCAENGRSIDDTRAFLALLTIVEGEG